MIALIRKNLRLWGYGKSLALFTGCILFSISGRLNGGIAYERHILSAVSDHYYLTYFVLPIVLLSCFSFIDDDGGGLRKNGFFLLNTIFDGEELVNFIPNKVKRYFAKNNITVYYINATKIAQEIGLGNRTYAKIMSML